MIDLQDKRKAKQLHHTVQIQQAAERLFAEKGFHLTTVEEIAREANLGKGTIYLHFSNKKDLFLSVIERQLKILLKKIESGIVDESSGTRKIKKAISIHLTFLEKNANFFKVFQTFPEQFKRELEEELLQRVIAVNARYLDLIEKLIQQAIREGDIRDLNPRKLAAMLVGVIHSLTIYWAYGDRQDALSADEALAWEFFWRGVASSRGPAETEVATSTRS